MADSLLYVLHVQYVYHSTRAKTNIINPNESNIPKTNEYSNIL